MELTPALRVRVRVFVRKNIPGCPSASVQNADQRLSALNPQSSVKLSSVVSSEPPGDG